GRRRRGVAGRRANHRAGSARGGSVHRQHHAAILEAPGRVGPLVLQVEILKAELGPQPPRPDERGCTLAERDRKGLLRLREKRAIALEQRRWGGHWRRV